MKTALTIKSISKGLKMKMLYTNTIFPKMNRNRKQNRKKKTLVRYMIKKQHRERDIEAVNAEREAIDKVTCELPEQK